MRTLYCLFCVLTLAASIRVAGQFTSAMQARHSSVSGTLSSLPAESARVPALSAPVRDLTASGAEASQVLTVQPAADRPSRHPSTAEFTTGKQSPEAFESPVHPAPLHPTMITPGNFQYLGAFRTPDLTGRSHTFAYGGWGIAWRPDGDPDGPEDGFPGSLYLAGHKNEQQVAEISIPAPGRTDSKQIDRLPAATLLQDFADVTDGILSDLTAGSSEPFQLGGLLVKDGRLHWTMHKYYNVENLDYPSHGTSGLNLQATLAEGPWHLGPLNSSLPEWNSYKHAGYIFEVPQSVADRWFGGRNVISGLQISTGLQASSQGPAMFVYQLPAEGTPPGAELDAIPLCWYSQQQPLSGHHPADRWSGGAWLTLGDKQAVVIAGRKSLGAFYYGEARSFDCTPDKGYHGTPYEFQLLFYSPESLIHAAHLSLPATAIEPWLRWTGTHAGGGPGQYLIDTCQKHTGGLAYDRTNNLLYLSQTDAGLLKDSDEPLPVIHVFRITSGEH